jgi:hypothetical protein
MERFIAETNITFLRKLLAGRLEPHDREVLERLLAEAEAQMMRARSVSR